MQIVNRQLTRPHGQSLLLNFFPIRGEGGVDQVGCLFSDVTEFMAAQQIITLQQQAIRELSAPILELQDGLLIVTLVGTIDAIRARALTEQLLPAIGAKRARVVVVDVTG